MKKMLCKLLISCFCCAALCFTAFAAGAPGQADTGRILFVILIPALFALIVCSVMKAGMKSAKKQSNANSYVPDNGVTISVQMDRYTHTTETRRRLQNDQQRPHR